MKRMNIQNHAVLADAKWNMAQVLRQRYAGKTIPDEAKATIEHLEAMSVEHSRKSFIGQTTFVRK